MRNVNEPYEVWRSTGTELGDIEWRVLKKYQTPEKEAENPYARWLVAAKSDATFGSYDIGDTYIRDITGAGGTLVWTSGSPEEIEKW